MNQLLSSEKDNVTGVGRDESQMRGLKWDWRRERFHSETRRSTSKGRVSCL